MDLNNSFDNSKNPYISVVVAVYNSEKYIKQTLDSILAQSYSDFELILVDDGSTDSSPGILEEYAQKDVRIKLIFNKEESDGAALARNLGIEASSGKYLSILDADDFFESNMLEIVFEAAESNNADVVIFDGYRYDDRNQVDLERNTILCRDKIPYGKEVFSPDENIENLFSMTLGAAWNVLFRKEHVDKYALRFQSFHHADDLEFVLLNFALANRIAVLSERLIHYRVNILGSQASMISKWPDTAWQAMLSLKEKLIHFGIYEKYRISFIRKAMQYLSYYIDNMNTTDSFCRLYTALNEEKLENLGLATATAAEIGDPYFESIRDLIVSSTPDEYLFKKLHKEAPFDRAISWKKRIPEKSRLILYGADRMGVDVFHSILWEQDYLVIAWVDNQYNDLGYPILSPDVIYEALYDYILITTASKQDYYKKRDILIKQGIMRSKIQWIFVE